MSSEKDNFNQAILREKILEDQTKGILLNRGGFPTQSVLVISRYYYGLSKRTLRANSVSIHYTSV